MNEKSFRRVVRETKQQIIDAMNASGLPIDVMDMMLGELHNVVHAQAEAEYQQEMMQIQNQKVEAQAEPAEAQGGEE